MSLDVVLLSNEAATGTARQWPGGSGTFFCVGTFSGATVSLEVLMPDGSTWLALGSSTTITAAAIVPITTLAPCQIRCSVASGSPAGLYATAVRQVP
jgi:hypothetical protein